MYQLYQQKKKKKEKRKKKKKFVNIQNGLIC
jgi:hypothetical protein